MKSKNLRRAARETSAIAEVLASRLPAGCPLPPEDLFVLMWPVGYQLVRLERRAKQDRKAARRYRRLRAEIAELLRTQPDAPVPLSALLRSVPLDPLCWRTALVPGATADALEAA